MITKAIQLLLKGLSCFILVVLRIIFIFFKCRMLFKSVLSNLYSLSSHNYKLQCILLGCYVISRQKLGHNYGVCFLYKQKCEKCGWHLCSDLLHVSSRKWKECGSTNLPRHDHPLKPFGYFASTHSYFPNQCNKYKIFVLTIQHLWNTVDVLSKKVQKRTIPTTLSV